MIHLVRFSRPILAIVLLAAAFAPRSARAALSIEAAEIGFGGTYAAGLWTPIRVFARNAPDPKRPGDKVTDFEGIVRVSILGREGRVIRYERELELESQSRKLIEFPVLIPERPAPIEVELINAKRRVMARKVLSIGATAGLDQRHLFRIRPTVLLEDDPNERVNFPSWVTTRFNVHRIALDALPSDARSYSAVRLLVIRRRLSNRLSDRQLDALDEWLRLGGRLAVITPRNQAEFRVEGEWLADHLPAPVESASETDIRRIMPSSTEARVLFTRWGAPRSDARVDWDSPEGPVLLSRPVGAGSIHALSVDPLALGEAFGGPFGLELQQRLEAILLAPEREDLRARHYWSTAKVDFNFENVMDLTTTIWIASGVLLVFVVVVGPLNFHMLRKRRRLELAWVTIPVLSIFFFFAIYGFGALTKGGAQFWGSVDLLHLYSGESRGLMLSSASQFVPRSGDYRFSSSSAAADSGGDRGATMPFQSFYEPPSASLFNWGAPVPGGGPLTLGKGRPATARLLTAGGYDVTSRPDQWTLAYYQGERSEEIEGAITGLVTLLPSNAALIRVENTTPADLTDARLFVGDREFELGTIRAGETYSEEWNESIPANSRERDAAAISDPFIRSAVNNVSLGAYEEYPVYRKHSPQRRCRLVARQDLWTAGTSILPAPELSRTCPMVEVELPITVRGGVLFESWMTRRNNLLRFEIYDYDPDSARFFEDEETLCRVYDGWFEVLAGPPRHEGRMDFDSGTCEVVYSGLTSALEILAFNFETGAWEQAISPSAPAGVVANHTALTVRLHRRWINPHGGYMRLHFESHPKKDGSGGQNFPGFGESGSITFHEINFSVIYNGADAERIAGALTPALRAEN